MILLLIKINVPPSNTGSKNNFFHDRQPTYIHTNLNFSVSFLEKIKIFKIKSKLKQTKNKLNQEKIKTNQNKSKTNQAEIKDLLEDKDKEKDKDKEWIRIRRSCCKQQEVYARKKLKINFFEFKWIFIDDFKCIFNTQ